MEMGRGKVRFSHDFVLVRLIMAGLAGFVKYIIPHFFTVPELGPDKACAMYVLHAIIADVESTRPKNH